MKKFFSGLAVAIPSPLAVSTEAADKRKIRNSTHPIWSTCLVPEKRGIV
ncbi:MAG: hypothetical protein WB696_06245 [Chthoniobacterales bacterium]